MYEFLQRTPVFHAYQRFCRLVGEDTMGYTEFAYYYYGIGNGTLDLYSEMCLETKRIGLSEMPLGVVSDIVSHLEQRDRFVARKLCRNFRAGVDWRTIEIETIRAEFFEEFTSLFFDKSEFEYVDLLGGCRVVEVRGTNGGVKGKQIDIAMGDLGRVINTPKANVGTLNLTLMKIDDIELRKNRYEEIRDRIKQWSCANVETLMLGGLYFNEVASILANFGVEKLVEIKMDMLAEEEVKAEVAEEVAKLEQWKSAKVIEINESCKLDLGIAHFLHCHVFSVALKKFTVEDAVIVRDNLIKSADFESADIHVQITNPMEIAQVFQAGDFIPGAVISYSEDGADFRVEVYSNQFKIEKDLQ